jgi:hypothetical protein
MPSAIGPSSCATGLFDGDSCGRAELNLAVAESITATKTAMATEKKAFRQSAIRRY